MNDATSELGNNDLSMKLQFAQQKNLKYELYGFLEF